MSETIKSHEQRHQLATTVEYYKAKAREVFERYGDAGPCFYLRLNIEGSSSDNVDSNEPDLAVLCSWSTSKHRRATINAIYSLLESNVASQFCFVGVMLDDHDDPSLEWTDDPHRLVVFAKNTDGLEAGGGFDIRMNNRSEYHLGDWIDWKVDPKDCAAA